MGDGAANPPDADQSNPKRGHLTGPLDPPVPGPHATVPGDDTTQCREEKRDRVVCDSIGVRARCIGHDDSSSPSSIEVHRFDTDSVARYNSQPRRAVEMLRCDGACSCDPGDSLGQERRQGLKLMCGRAASDEESRVDQSTLEIVGTSGERPGRHEDCRHHAFLANHGSRHS